MPWTHTCQISGAVAMCGSALGGTHRLGVGFSDCASGLFPKWRRCTAGNETTRFERLSAVAGAATDALEEAALLPLGSRLTSDSDTL
jgi:hypothetical protein